MISVTLPLPVETCSVLAASVACSGVCICVACLLAFVGSRPGNMNYCSCSKSIKYQKSMQVCQPEMTKRRRFSLLHGTKELILIRDDSPTSSCSVITTTTSASSGELYSYMPAHSVTHRNSDATEGRGRNACQYGMSHHATTAMCQCSASPRMSRGMSLLVLDNK